MMKGIRMSLPVSSLLLFLFVSLNMHSCSSFLASIVKHSMDHTVGCVWEQQQQSVYEAVTKGSRRSRGTRLEVMPSSSKFYASDSRKREPDAPINNQIKFSPVRVIKPGPPGDDGVPTEEMAGIFSIQEAQEMADELGVDLVLINDKGDPPVTKIIDYGKYKYSMERKKKENQKKQSKQDLKEVKMSYKIDQHDFQVRVNRVQEFISKGDKVKVVVQFKGREMQYKELGRELLLRVYNPVEDIANIEAPPKIEGRAMAMMLGPKQKQK